MCHCRIVLNPNHGHTWFSRSPKHTYSMKVRSSPADLIVAVAHTTLTFPFPLTLCWIDNRSTTVKMEASVDILVDISVNN